jgi:hypothetical protein
MVFRSSLALSIEERQFIKIIYYNVVDYAANYLRTCPHDIIHYTIDVSTVVSRDISALRIGNICFLLSVALRRPERALRSAVQPFRKGTAISGYSL